VLHTSIRSLRDGLLSLAYPSQCRLCANTIESWDDGPTCAECWADPATTVLLWDKPICEKCGLPLSPLPPPSNHLPDISAESNSIQQRTCGTCMELPLDRIRSVGLYRGTLEANVLFLKSKPHICRRLFDLMKSTCAQSASELSGDLIVPVPLHPSRRRERGFNQAAIIARSLSKIMNLPIAENVLKRIKPTERHRAGMDAFDRSKSIAGAFDISKPNNIEGRRILLVDDLCTTGSTLGEAAQILRESGAAKVSAFTLARAAIGAQR